MRRLIVTIWFVLAVFGVTAGAGPVLFEAGLGSCEGPPYPSLSPLNVGIRANDVGGMLKETSRVLVNLKQAVPPIPLRMTSSNRGGGDYAVESFFDIFTRVFRTTTRPTVSSTYLLKSIPAGACRREYRRSCPW